MTDEQHADEQRPGEDSEERTDTRSGEMIEEPGGDSAEADGDAVTERFAALNDRYLRLAAEFDNYRKRRADRDQTVRREALRSTLSALLPALDDLHRAVEHPAADAEDYRSGVRAVVDKLDRALESLGVRRMNPRGEPFDPELHECLAAKPDAGAAPDTVVEVFADGYRLGDFVLRPAQVVVAVTAAGGEKRDTETDQTGNADK